MTDSGGRVAGWMVAVTLWLSSAAEAQYRAKPPAPPAPPVMLAVREAPRGPATSPSRTSDDLRLLQRPSKNCQWMGPSDNAGPCAWRDHFGPRLLPPMGLERAMLTGVDWFASTSGTTAERQGSAAQVQLMHRALEATRAKVDADFRAAVRRRP
ncbi:MAG: hypothetical protein SFW08_07105 [Gemmatimonadaceae bacterium]|nr:hypothetical protein [Gemmatimonadaceae bacterium]